MSMEQNPAKETAEHTTPVTTGSEMASEPASNQAAPEAEKHHGVWCRTKKAWSQALCNRRNEPTEPEVVPIAAENRTAEPYQVIEVSSENLPDAAAVEKGADATESNRRDDANDASNLAPLAPAASNEAIAGNIPAMADEHEQLAKDKMDQQSHRLEEPRTEQTAMSNGGDASQESGSADKSESSGAVEGPIPEEVARAFTEPKDAAPVASAIESLPETVESTDETTESASENFQPAIEEETPIVEVIESTTKHEESSM